MYHNNSVALAQPGRARGHRAGASQRPSSSSGSGGLIETGAARCPANPELIRQHRPTAPGLRLIPWLRVSPVGVWPRGQSWRDLQRVHRRLEVRHRLAECLPHQRRDDWQERARASKQASKQAHALRLWLSTLPLVSRYPHSRVWQTWTNRPWQRHPGLHRLGCLKAWVSPRGWQMCSDTTRGIGVAGFGGLLTSISPRASPRITLAFHK